MQQEYSTDEDGKLILALAIIVIVLAAAFLMFANPNTGRNVGTKIDNAAADVREKATETKENIQNSNTVQKLEDKTQEFKNDIKPANE